MSAQPPPPSASPPAPQPEAAAQVAGSNEREVKVARSSAWDHFIRLSDWSQCKYCKTKYSTNSATSTLLHHLTTHHRNKLTLTNDKQPTLEATFFVIPPSTKEKIDDALLDWIIMDHQSYQVVDEPSFKRYSQALNKAYVPPCRQTVSSKIIARLPDVKEAIKIVLAKAPGKLTCSTDGWSCRTFDGYVTVTVHWMTEKWELESLVIGFEKITDSHRAEDLSKRLLHIFAEYNIGHKIQAIVSDNAANAINASELTAAELKKLHNVDVIVCRCLAHIIHLIVKDGLKGVEGPIVALRDAAEHFHRSGPDRERLKATCTIRQEVFHLPATDVMTRWNSTLRLYNSMAPMRKSLTELIPELNADAWKALDKAAKILGPFAEASETLQADATPTMSRVPFIIKFLKKHIAEVSKQKDLSAVINHGLPGAAHQHGLDFRLMIEKLEKYEEDVKEQSRISAFLDPRFSEGLDKTDFNAAAEYLKARVPRETATPTITSMEEAYLSAGRDAKFPNHPELQHYHRAAVLDYKGDLLRWWKENEATYPHLAKVARDYHAMLASSAPAERAFSAAGNTVTEKRTRLSSTSIEANMIQKSWLEYLERNP